MQRQRALLFLVIACLSACGSATSAAPATTNPPIIKRELPVPAPPGGDAAWTLAFKQLGVGLTLPNHRWKPRLVTEDDGGTFMKADLEGTSVSLFLKAYLSTGTPLRELMESDRQKFLADPNQTVSDIEDDGDGRWMFTVNTKTTDGVPVRAKLYFVPSPTKPDGFFSMAVVGTAEDVEAYARETHGIIESLKPLPE